MKAYPVADGGCARHLCSMLQPGRARCTAKAIVAPFRQ
jgi:hypothetical protein